MAATAQYDTAGAPPPPRAAAAARWAAIFLIALGAVLQLVWFPAAPLWTLLIVALSVVLVYQLTVNWRE